MNVELDCIYRLPLFCPHFRTIMFLPSFQNNNVLSHVLPKIMAQSSRAAAQAQRGRMLLVVPSAAPPLRPTDSGTGAVTSSVGNRVDIAGHGNGNRVATARR